MAFIDNSGDIILDAVLTDTGRKRMAKGDGSFRIVSFALADDEINYGLYDSANPNGSAYYDLEILKTPILEAFTNNMSSMKSKLLTISRTNLLYLPVLAVNTGTNTSSRQYFAGGKTEDPVNGKDLFIVSVDQSTDYVFMHEFSSSGSGSGGIEDTDYLPANIVKGGKGVISGIGSASTLPGFIRLDQGLNTTDIPHTFGLDRDLTETQYIIEIDYRLGYITSTNSSRPLEPNYVDDDDIASYLITNADSGFVDDNISKEEATANGSQVIAGPRGTFLKFKIQSSIELQTSTYLFNKMGSKVSSITAQDGIPGMGFKHHFIDSSIRVTGVTTGYSIDVPVRFVKYDTDI